MKCAININKENMSTAIEFNNISKLYRLGLVSSGTLSSDLQRWWQMNILGKEDPFLKVGSVNDRSKAADSDYVWALKDIDFKVEQGDVVGIIGKNGAGKSTLLKLLSKVTAPTTGTIKAKGRIASLLEVGTGFHPELTGRENIYMNGTILGMTKQEINSKLDEIVAFSGCERYIDTPVKRYSSGMSVRLGFAVAAHLDPEILVVDEVLAVGDAEFQKKAIGKMQDVSRGEGRTVLFVSHNMVSIRSLCKTGVLLENGSVKFMGEVNDTIDEYMKSNIADFEGKKLSDRPREGRCTDQVHFSDIQFLDEHDEFIEPHCGKYLKVRVFFDVKESCKDCNIGLGFRDFYGTPIMSTPTELIFNTLPLSGGSHYADCIIPKLPLTESTYTVALSAGIKGEFADFVLNAATMNVQDDDYYNVGKTVAGHMKGKIVLCDYKWEVN